MASRMTKDDKINLAVLIAALAFLAWAVPSQLRTYDDAERYRAMLAGFR